MIIQLNKFVDIVQCRPCGLDDFLARMPGHEVSDPRKVPLRVVLPSVGNAGMLIFYIYTYICRTRLEFHIFTSLVGIGGRLGIGTSILLPNGRRCPFVHLILSVTGFFFCSTALYSPLRFLTCTWSVCSHGCSLH